MMTTADMVTALCAFLAVGCAVGWFMAGLAQAFSRG
jgi:hypothetical protein